MTNTEPRRRNRRGEGGKLRDEIIAAAVALLDEGGDERAVTLRSVARKAGIAAPSIYPHFADQPSIMLAVVQQEMDALTATLREAADNASPDARARLFAVCNAYLDFAELHPQRYRIMFGGLWTPSVEDTSITDADLDSLGAEAFTLLVDVLGACVEEGIAHGSDDLFGDAVALWLGLHGLAHQRAVVRKMPGPADVGDRLIKALAHLK
ncbi:TetR/AcrR family transcriptional regulator [Lentzea sp. BCCO 10_0798]|uniref:TetR/AcrR family transcriptional regulator n=1 Tax=Lentzea kristufekii TaxID=3095430 RepID=A0ABU4TUN6_9PSEU|nr:TetR/AcrR family transcriptional regulator [Lentzea sp. BCCO 10_0798]MDX8052023.1 TetR/AcrR family transcriptional regulator [Lentzea sp. BCCO 10_0798]